MRALYVEITWTEHERNADHAARGCERFDYSIVKITRFYDYQTWQKQFWINSWGLFSWLCFRLLIGWADKLRSRGLTTCRRRTHDFLSSRSNIPAVSTAFTSEDERHASARTLDRLILHIIREWHRDWTPRLWRLCGSREYRSVMLSFCKLFHSNPKTSSWDRNSCCKNMCKLSNR